MSKLNINAAPFVPSSSAVSLDSVSKLHHHDMTTQTNKPLIQENQRKTSKRRQRKGKLDVTKDSKLLCDNISPVVESYVSMKTNFCQSLQSAKYQTTKRSHKPRVNKTNSAPSISGAINSGLNSTSPQSDQPLFPGALSWSSRALQGHLYEQQRQERDQRLRDVINRKVLLHPLGNSGSSRRISQDNVKTCSKKETLSSSISSVDIFSMPSTRSWNFRKLRDKWWNALQHNSQDCTQKAPDPPNVGSIINDVRYGSSVKHANTNDVDMMKIHFGDFHIENSFDDSDSDTAIDQLTPENTIPYDCDDYPLYQAIFNDDLVGVEQLLKQYHEHLYTTIKPIQLGLSAVSQFSEMLVMTPLHLAIILGRSLILQTLLNDNGLIRWILELSMEYSPLMLAIEKSITEETCLDILVHHEAIIPGLTRDKFLGDSALHHACRCGIPVSSFQELLHCMARGSGKGNLIQKLLTSKNSRGQTPMHIVCAYRHSHLLESLLQNCSPSLLQKIFRTQDDDHKTPLLAAIQAEATDVVMTLLMWRGNYHDKGRFFAPSREVEEELCPLVYAVSCGSLEMIHTLLEFHDPDSYHLDTALQVSIQTSASLRLDITRILIEVGANPCAIGTNFPMQNQLSAFSIATIQGDNGMLKLLIDSYQEKLQNRQTSRRRDPQLQNQPESYFSALEGAEIQEYECTLNDALISSLFQGYSRGIWDCWNVSLLLFQKGAKLDDIGLSRLKKSIHDGKLKPSHETSSNNRVRHVFACEYFHYDNPNDFTDSLQ
jgi:ankyrin repeat protein